MRLCRLMLFVVVGLCSSLSAFASQTTEPVSRLEIPKWKTRHEAVCEQVKQGDIDLVFLGDSITQGWEKNGKKAWKKHFAKYKPANLGFGGDRTQHVLWRLDNGEIEGINPKLAVLMIGTNNSNKDDHTGEEIGEGIQAIVKKLREKRMPRLARSLRNWRTTRWSSTSISALSFWRKTARCLRKSCPIGCISVPRVTKSGPTPLMKKWQS
jgi:hypothetical protein